MIFKVGKKEQPRRPKTGRVPLNYYRKGQTEPKASPFARKSVKKSKTRKYVVRVLDIAVLIVLLGLLLYSLFVNSTPKIDINSTVYHSSQVYQEAAAKYLGALQDRNKITLNEQAVINKLKIQFPEISTATIELPLFSETPIIHLKIAKPSFFLSGNGQNYIIDSQGTATAVAKNVPEIKILATLNDQSGFKTKPGEQVLSAQSVSFINTVLAQMGQAQVPIASLTLPPQAQELDLRTSDQSYYVKFYMGGDPLLQSGQMLAARSSFAQSGKQPSQYLDVRVPGKIFYK